MSTPRNPSPAVTAVQARDVFGTLYKGCAGRLEVRALPSKSQRFFELNDYVGMARFCEDKGEDLYFGVATRRSDRDGTLANCAQLPALFVDLDMAGATKADALSRLNACLCPPSVVINSGGGYHAYWLLREPLELDDAKEDAYRFLRGLAAEIGGDPAAAEPARILRIPNTLNYKYSPSRRVTVVVFEPDRRYKPSDFDWLPEANGRPNSSASLVDLSEPIRQGQRNEQLYRLGRGLKAKGLTTGLIGSALRSVNAEQCLPPLKTDEIKALIAQVVRQTDRNDFRPPAERRDEPLVFTELENLLTESDELVEWIVTDMIAAGSANILAAPPKVGKSTAARVLALEVARGGTFLGHPCTPAPVWYVALEDKRSEVKKHLLRLGATGSDPLRFFFRQPVRNLLGQLTALAEEERPGLIIVDTLQRLINAKDLNDYAETTSKIDPILTLARETGAAVLLVHHAGKADRAGIGAVLGSTALAGSVDNVFLMKRTERYRLLRSEQRIGPNIEDVVVALDETTGNITCGPSKHDADVTCVATELLASIHNAAEPLTSADWGQTVEARRTVWLAAQHRLVEQGQVDRTGTGKKGAPYRYCIPVSSSRVPPNRGEPASSLSSEDENTTSADEKGGSGIPTLGAEREAEDVDDLDRF